jgi:hypothetical protein
MDEFDDYRKDLKKCIAKPYSHLFSYIFEFSDEYNVCVLGCSEAELIKIIHKLKKLLKMMEQNLRERELVSMRYDNTK